MRRAGSSASRRCSPPPDRKSTRLNSSHSQISYAVFCLKKKKQTHVVIYIIDLDVDYSLQVACANIVVLNYGTLHLVCDLIGGSLSYTNISIISVYLYIY